MQKYINSALISRGSSLIPFSNAMITVLNHEGGTMATIYSDNGETLKANPFYTNTVGDIEFYAADGRYDVRVSGSGYPTTTISDILLEDLQDGDVSFTDVVVENLVVTGEAEGPGNSPFVTDADLSASAGSDLVGFLQSGTGAVARTVQEKAREVVSVKDFGAAGDGVADDTTSIQSAVDYAASVDGAVIYVPSGEYKLSSTILVQNSNIKLRCAGNDMQHLSGGTGNGPATKFSWHGAASEAMFSFISPQGSTNHKNVGQELSGCMLDGRGVAGKGINITSVNELLLSRIHIENVTEDAVYTRCYDSGDLADATDNQRMLFSVVTFNLNGGTNTTDANGINLGGSSVIPGGNTSLNVFELCQGGTENGIPLLIDNADNCNFIRCGFTCAVTGTNAVEIRGNGASGSNHFYNLTATRTGSGGAAAIRILGTVSGYANDSSGNSFWMSDNSNGTQAPDADAGCQFTVMQDNGYAYFDRFDTIAVGDDAASASRARENAGNSSVTIDNGANAHIKLLADEASKSFNVNIQASSGDFRIQRTGGSGIISLAPNTFVHLRPVMNVAVMSASGGAGTSDIVLVDASGGNVTVSLPLTTAYRSGMSPELRIIRIDSSANTVTVSRQGSDTINGGTSETLTVGQGKTYVCNPSSVAWYSY